MVDIAAALSQEAKVLLMDEPTAALTPNEVDRLFTIMRKLREQGTSIVFISHRLEEVFTIADRISVMRDGEMVGQRIPAETSADEIIHLMVGRELTKLFERPTNYQIGAPVLQVRNMSRAGKFQDVSFEVRAGEIVGMAGLVGAGRSFVGQSIFGIAPVDSGEIVIEGNPARISSPREAMARGLAYVPEDRQQQGLFMPMSIAQNATLPTINHLARYGWLRNEAERKATYEYVERLRIILRNVDQPVRELSGGNQQKVVLSKWLMSKPKVIILDEPTRGVDIGAKAEVHRLMGELAAQGIGILMISSELPEIMAMSDRVLVMHEGRLAACLDKSELTAERIMAAATGQMVEGELI
jgi:rhamnose transport system ATP-binding protein